MSLHLFNSLCIGIPVILFLLYLVYSRTQRKKYTSIYRHTGQKPTWIPQPMDEFKVGAIFIYTRGNCDRYLIEVLDIAESDFEFKLLKRISRNSVTSKDASGTIDTAAIYDIKDRLQPHNLTPEEVLYYKL